MIDFPTLLPTFNRLRLSTIGTPYDYQAHSLPGTDRGAIFSDFFGLAMPNQIQKKAGNDGGGSGGRWVGRSVGRVIFHILQVQTYNKMQAAKFGGKKPPKIAYMHLNDKL